MRQRFRRTAVESLRAGLLGLLCANLIACDEQSNISRLTALPISQASGTQMADKMDSELSPRLLRRFTSRQSQQDRGEQSRAFHHGGTLALNFAG